MPELSLLELVIEAARIAPSADNSQPWQFRLHDQTLFVHHRQSAGTDLFGPGGHATLLSIGALAENVCQIVPESRQTMKIIDLTKGEPYFSLTMPSQIAELSAADFALFKRHTNRFRYSKTPPDTDILNKISQQQEHGAKIQILTSPEERRRFSNTVETCCRARFCNRDLHEWLMGSLRFSETEIDRGDGLAIKTINLPPGGNLFMRWIRPWQRMALLNKIGAFKLMANTEARLLRSAPLILTISGEDSPQGAFNAGKLMERIWILLNQFGWAAHPYYVVTDQETRLRHHGIPEGWKSAVANAVRDTRAHLNLTSGERLHMAMRVGKPTKEPSRSLRLPVDSLLLSNSTDNGN